MATNVQANLLLNTAPAQASFNNFARAIGSAKFAQPLGRITGDATEFRKSLEAATARVTAFGLTAGAIYKVSQAIREGAKATLEVDKQLVELNTYLGQSRKELEGFSQSLFKVAKNAAVPFEAASEAAKEFARQGLSANEILKRTESALTLARISGISYSQAVNGITTALNSFSKEALTASEITNKLIAVDTRFAVSSAQLNEALTRVGSSAEESGISIDKLIATVTAAQQITGRGGAVIGNALKTIFTRLQRPEVLNQLEQLGVAIKDQNGFLLDGISILKNYSDATKNLSQAEKARTAELVGGIYQINQVNALIKDLSSSNSVYANALKISSAATDEAKKKNEELNKSLSALLEQTKTSAQQAAAALGQSLLEPIVKLGSAASEALLKIVDPNSVGEEMGAAIAKGAASALGRGLVMGGGPLLAATGGLLAAKMFKYVSASAKELGRFSTDMFTSEKELQIQKRINDTLRQSPGIIADVRSGKMSLVDAEREVLRLIQEQNRNLLTQSRITGRVTSTVTTAQNASKKGFFGRIFADGYVPGLSSSVGLAALEENTARRMGAKNPKARMVQATIKGKTGPVMVNDQEKVIPNYAGTGETAIIPNYRNFNDIPRMSKGYVPNFAFDSLKTWYTRDRKIVDPETYSYLRYALTKDKKAINLVFSKSEQKGQGWQMFERLGKTAKRIGLPVKSDVLSSQANDVLDISDASLAKAGKYGIEEVLKVAYPQLIYRQKGSSKGTSLSVNLDNGLNNTSTELSGKNIFSIVSEFASKQYKGDSKLLRNSIIDGSFDLQNIVTNFAGGRIPNFAKRRDVIQKIGKKEIFARFQKHFEKGKDYQGFYNIHGEEFTNRKLTDQEAKIYANITSAISPSVPDYVAAQFAAPIFNRFMQTRSTNVEDYFDLAPSKIVSRHKNVASLGLFGKKGEMSAEGNIRTRDDARRYGLSKALRGVDLGSDDTAKTRHYARAILQDKTAFPIDTNVIQAILGGKKPSETEAKKLIALANEFATLNKIETGAAGLQAAIFKSNSKHAEKYSPETVRSALSGIKGRSGGYVPNFANVNAEKLILGGKGRNLILTSAYDSLKADLDPSSQVSGGISYGLKFPDRSYASTARSAGVDAMQVLHDYAKKQGGRAYYAPHVPSSAMSKYGTAAGGMNKRNIFFLQQLVSKNKRDFPRSFVQSVLSINPSSASLINTGSLYDQAVKHLSKKGLSAIAIGKKFREGSAGLHDPAVEQYSAQNKYSVSSVVSRVSDVGGSVAAPASYHPLYPRSTYADSQISLSRGIDLPSEFERLTGVKVAADKLDPENTRYQPLASFLPFGMRFEEGDEISKMIGLAKGYVPNFAREKIIAAAFKTKKGNIFTGSYHGAAYEKIPEGENIDLIDGFVTNSGKFVDRKEAGLIAQAAHQLYNNGNNRKAFASNNYKLDTAFLPLPQEKYHSRGYIPNFAGLSDAVSREKTMSGLPVSQIMAHFDGKGNPVAVTNKRDEPRGLKDVPNFAIPRSLLKRFAQFKRGTFGNPISASLEVLQGSFLSSIIDQLAEAEKISPEASAFTTGGVPAAYGLKNIGRGIFGKGSRLQKGFSIASGLGQVAYGIGVGSQAGDDVRRRINEKRYEEALDRSRKTYQDLTENTLELSNTLAKLDAAYRDPKADPKQITKLAKIREDLINKVSLKNPELVSKLASEQSIEGKINILEENTKESQRQQSIREQALKFSARGAISGKEAPKEIGDFFASIINAGNENILKQDLSKATTANFGDVLKAGGLNVEELSNVFKTDDLKKAFIDALKVTQKLSELSTRQERDITALSRPLAAQQQRVADAKEVRGEIRKALQEQLPELASFAGTFSKRAGISASSDAALAIKRTDAAVSFQNSLLAQLSDKEFAKGLPSEVESRLRNIDAPGKAAAKELETLKSLPGLSEKQIEGLDKLIGFNSQQARSVEKATIIANETKNIQLKFLALQEKLAFGGDIRTSINPQMRNEAMAAGIRGPLTYQLGGLLGSRRTQVGGAVDFLTDTIQKYPGLLQTKGGKEPMDIQAVKRELTGINAMDMQRDLLKRAGMAQMMGLGQTSGLLRSKAFDQGYLMESAGLKANALFGGPEVPEEIKNAMGEYERFNVQSARQSRAEDAALKTVEDFFVPLKQRITDQFTAEGNQLAKSFQESLKTTFGDKGIIASIVNVTTEKINSIGSSGNTATTPVVQNFANPINDAVTREKMALAKRGIIGVPNFSMASINLERSPDLVTSSNPQGFGVTNSIDEKNGLRSLGMRSSGFVPNYAMPSWMNASNLDKVRNIFTNADDAKSLIGNVQEGNAGGIATDLAGPALDAAKFLAKGVAKKAGLGAAGLGLDIGEYIVKPLSEKAGLTDYIADRMYGAYESMQGAASSFSGKNRTTTAFDTFNKLGGDLTDPSPEWMKKGRVPNFAKSRMEELLERIYGPRADAPKPVVPSLPAPILGVSQKTMPFYPERLVNETYPYGSKPSIGNVNPTAKPQKSLPKRDPKTGRFLSKSQSDLMEKIEQGKLAKAAKKAQLAQGSPSGFSSLLAKPGLQQMLALTPEEQARIRRGAFESSQRAGAVQMAEYQRVFLAQKASEFQPSVQSGGLKLIPRGQSPTPLFSGKIISKQNTSPLGLLPRGKGTFKGQDYVPTGAAADRVRSLRGETRTRIGSANLKMQSERVIPKFKLPAKNPYLEAFLASDEKESRRILEKTIRENFKSAQQQERQAAANRYFERTAPQRAQMKAFSEAQQARLAKEAADKIRSGQRIDLSDVVRRYGKSAFAKGRSANLRSVIENIDTINLNAGASNFKEYTAEEVKNILSKKPSTPSASIVTPKPSGIFGKAASSSTVSGGGSFSARGAGKNALKFLGKYGGRALGGIGGAASIYEYYEGFQEAKKDKYAGAAKMFEATGGLAITGAGLAGAGLATTLALPLAVGALGYGAIKGVEATGLLDAMYGAGYGTVGLGAIGSKSIRGMTSRTAFNDDMIVARKQELLKEINRYNSVAGNPLVSTEFQLSRSAAAQNKKDEQDLAALMGNLDRESEATRAAIAARAAGAGAAETARLNKQSAAEEDARSSSLRRSFLESFDKNAESAGYLTTQDRVNFLLGQEGKNGLGSFRSTDFADPEFARSFNTYKEARNKFAATEAPTTLEFKSMQSQARTGFSDDVLREAVARGVSAETIEEERARKQAAAQGAIPNFAAMSNSMMSSGDVYSRMRATSARSSMGSYSGGYIPNFAAGDFTNAITEALRNGITSAFPDGPSSSSVSNSNVINIDGRTSIQNAPDEAMQGIISILFDKIPELKKLGPAALNFKR